MYPKFKSLSMLLAMAAALSLTACKEEVFEGNDPAVEDGDYMYVSAAIALPSAGTRSATDEYDPDDPDNENGDFGNTNSDEDQNENPDFEWGYDYENDVRSLILLITNTNDEFIAYTAVNGITQAPAGYNPFDFVVNGEIKHSDLVEAYGENGPLKGDDPKKVRIYAYCNYTLELVDSLATLKQKDTKWINWSGTVTESPSLAGQKPTITNTIWASRSFLMTNARVFETSFPTKITDWDNFADKNHPYRLTDNAEVDNLGDDGKNYDKNSLAPIYVERAAARIDFRDGSPKDNTYPLEIPVSSSETKEPFNVKLTRMALVNMSNQFYYLRRVSNDGTANKLNDKGEDNGYILLGREWYNSENKSGNYVVDVNWDAKSQIKQPGSTTQGDDAITPENAADHFNFTLFENKKGDDAKYYNYNRDGWYVDNIDEVLKGKVDTWEGPNEYRIWRYLTENTIPAGIENQQTVQSTGIVFKGSILAGQHVDYEYKETVMGVDGKESEETVRYVSEEVELALLAASKHLEFKADADPMTKEEIEAVDVKAESKPAYNYPILYSFANRLYAGVEGLVKAAAVEEGEGSTLYFAAQEVLKNWYLEYKKPEEPKEGEAATPIKGTFKYAEQKPTPANGNEVQTLTIKIYYDIITKGKTDLNTGFAQCDVQLHSETFGTADGDPEEAAESLFMNLAPQFEITIYRASNEEDGEGWGYYCYYFYWNRHNDNQKSGLMGLMEFDVVRNNVYKLAVKKIGQLGHPRIPEYDPDPVDPNDPDEDPTNYLQVQIEVLPWVVRVNDIEF